MGKRYNFERQQFKVECVMDYMEYITSLQNEYKFFSDMLKRLEKKKKKTPGNGFAMMKCKEKIAELEKIFNEIDYAAQVTYD